MLDVLFASDADVLLLDEPDNFLDVPAKLALERQIRAAKKTVLMISHDREVLSGAVGSILTLEGNGAWTHGGPYRTYPAAREERQRRLGDAVKRWRDEERRLYRLMKTFKERARYSSDWAKKADAAETRWRRFREPGPPPPPSPTPRSPYGCAAATRRDACWICAHSASPTSWPRSRTRSTSASESG